jgi:hypothetical protein
MYSRASLYLLSSSLLVRRSLPGSGMRIAIEGSLGVGSFRGQAYKPLAFDGIEVSPLHWDAFARYGLGLQGKIYR